MKLQSHSQIANTCYDMCLLLSGSEAAAGQRATDLLHQPHPHPEAERVPAKDINPPQQHGMPVAPPPPLPQNVFNVVFSLFVANPLEINSVPKILLIIFYVTYVHADVMSYRNACVVHVAIRGRVCMARRTSQNYGDVSTSFGRNITTKILFLAAI